jgi:hypothetical protein
VSGAKRNARSTSIEDRDSEAPIQEPRSIQEAIDALRSVEEFQGPRLSGDGVVKGVELARFCSKPVEAKPRRILWLDREHATHAHRCLQRQVQHR